MYQKLFKDLSSAIENEQLNTVKSLLSTIDYRFVTDEVKYTLLAKAAIGLVKVYSVDHMEKSEDAISASEAILIALFNKLEEIGVDVTQHMTTPIEGLKSDQDQLDQELQVLIDTHKHQRYQKVKELQITIAQIEEALRVEKESNDAEISALAQQKHTLEKEGSALQGKIDELPKPANEHETDNDVRQEKYALQVQKEGQDMKILLIDKEMNELPVKLHNDQLCRVNNLEDLKCDLERAKDWCSSPNNRLIEGQETMASILLSLNSENLNNIPAIKQGIFKQILENELNAAKESGNEALVQSLMSEYGNNNGLFDRAVNSLPSGVYSAARLALSGTQLPNWIVERVASEQTGVLHRRCLTTVKETPKAFESVASNNPGSSMLSNVLLFAWNTAADIVEHIPVFEENDEVAFKGMMDMKPF